MVMSGVPAPRDARAHLVEHAAQLLDLGLARGVLERRAALGQRRRHHQVLGAGDRQHVEHDVGAAQPLRARGDVAVLELDARPHRLEPLEVLIDRARADRAAARQRHARAAVARDQRPEHQHRRAHGLDQLVGRLVVVDRRRVDARDAPALVFEAGAQAREQPPHRAHVAQPGDVAVAGGAARQQRRRQDGQRGVLGTRDAHLAVQAGAATDDDLLQGLPPDAVRLGGRAALGSRSLGRLDAGVLRAEASPGARLPARLPCCRSCSGDGRPPSRAARP